MATHVDQKGVRYPRLTGSNGNLWGMVYDEGDCSEPVWKIGTGSGPAQWAHLKTSGFRARADLRFTGTSDSPFVIIDRCNGFTVWGAGASLAGGDVINTSAFGAFRHDTNGLDRRNSRSDSTLNQRTRGVIPDSMLIRKDLMDYAKERGTDLGHVLEMFFVETDSSAGFVHPLINEEDRKFGFGAEGTRIAVSQAVDLASRSCSPEAHVIALTLQNYGAYLGDNSGNTSNIKVEQEVVAGGVWGGELQRDELAGCVTWDDFVVIEPGWQ